MWSLADILPGTAVINVLDIGAALGERPPYQSLVEAGKARVIGFEPDLKEIERLRQAYGKSHRFFPFFVGDGQPATFHETNWPPTGSLFEPNTALLEKFNNMAELTQPVGQHPVATKRIDDIEDIKDIDFIKIDVQGSELAVLQNALQALSKTLLIQAEVEFVELYKGQPLFADLDIFLRGQGFQFHSFDGFGTRSFKPMIRNNDPNAGFRQFLWSDALYVRDWMTLDPLPEIKLKKYAVLAHDLLKSYDLAYSVLQALDRKAKGTFASNYLAKLSQGPAAS